MAARTRKARKNVGGRGEVSLQWGVDYDDRYAFIAGFTSGGAAYGTTWEEAAKFRELMEACATQDSGEYDPFAD